jgi:predicted nucleotidyltransferase
MPTAQEQQVLLDLRRGLQSLYGDRLARLILFGSRARGDAEPESDYDVLVVLRGVVDPNEESRRTSEFLGDISLRNDTVVTCIFTSVPEFEKRQSPLLINVRREGVPVLPTSRPSSSRRAVAPSVRLSSVR